MNLSNEFHPCPKSQTEKRQPKVKVKKPKKPKTNKNIEMFHNRKIPHWKQRGGVSKETAEKAKEYYGPYCIFCGSPHISLHHVMHKGYGVGGRGVMTNLIPLCLHHHIGDAGPHKDPKMDEYLKHQQVQTFGSDYYKDKWDLWMEGKIESPTDELYDKFMGEHKNPT